MKKAELSSVSRPEILDAIKDDKSLILLNSIAKGEESDTEDLSALIKISRKEYYLRMSKLIKTGIVTRRQGKYVLTSFGKVIYELQLILVEAIVDTLLKRESRKYTGMKKGTTDFKKIRDELSKVKDKDLQKELSKGGTRISYEQDNTIS